MELTGYDNWKLATPPEYDREGARQSLIENEPHLSRLEHRADHAAARADKLTKLLAATPQSDRRDRLARLVTMAAREANYRANDLQAAIEDLAESPDREREDDR